MRTLNAQLRPWVAAIAAIRRPRVGAHGEAADGGDVVGDGLERGVGHQEQPSGRQVVCFASMNQSVGLPDLRAKSPRRTLWASRWSLSAGKAQSGRSDGGRARWRQSDSSDARRDPCDGRGQPEGRRGQDDDRAHARRGAGRAGQRVLLVDLDPAGVPHLACGIDPDRSSVSVHDVMLGRAKAADALVQASATCTSCPSTIDLAGAEVHLLTKTGREYVLRRALATARSTTTTSC